MSEKIGIKDRTIALGQTLRNNLVVLTSGICYGSIGTVCVHAYFQSVGVEPNLKNFMASVVIGSLSVGPVLQVITNRIITKINENRSEGSGYYEIKGTLLNFVADALAALGTGEAQTTETMVLIPAQDN